MQLHEQSNFMVGTIIFIWPYIEDNHVDNYFQMRSYLSLLLLFFFYASINWHMPPHESSASTLHNKKMQKPHKTSLLTYAIRRGNKQFQVSRTKAWKGFSYSKNSSCLCDISVWHCNWYKEIMEWKFKNQKPFLFRQFSFLHYQDFWGQCKTKKEKAS